MNVIQTVNGRLGPANIKQQLADLITARNLVILDVGLRQLDGVRSELNNALLRSMSDASTDALTLVVEALDALRHEIIKRTRTAHDGTLEPTETLDITALVGIAIKRGRTPSTTVQEMATALEAAAQLTRGIRARADALDIMAARAVRMAFESDFSGISFMYEVVGYVCVYALSIRNEDEYKRRRLELALGFARDALEIS